MELRGLILLSAISVVSAEPATAAPGGEARQSAALEAEARAVTDRLDRETLVDECPGLLFGYLSATERDEEDPGGPDFFQVWG